MLCEKPLTTDVTTSYELVQKEAALGRTLVQVGFMRRYDTEYVALKKLIVGGGLGRVLQLHCTHRNPAVPDHFNSEFMIRDSVVHEVDVTRFLLDSEITSVQVLAGAATEAAPEGTHDPMLVVFETAAGALVTDEIYVRSGVAYEVRTEAVGERGSALIGLDQNLTAEVDRRSLGWADHPGLRRAFRLRLRRRAAALGERREPAAPSTGRGCGTATPPSRSARPGSRPCGPDRRSRSSWASGRPRHLISG